MTSSVQSNRPGLLPNSIQRRVDALTRLEIDYIPSASFEVPGVCDIIDHSASVSTGAGRYDIRHELPSHLERLCETELLNKQQESVLFRQMNYFKFLASELRVGLQCDEPDPLLLDAIERLLSQAREIRDHLIKANMRLVMSIVKDFVTPRLTFDELLSEGTITLMQAVEKFDFDRGFRFSTYAYRSIARTAYRCVAASREEESRVTREADEWAYGQGDLQQSSSMSDQFWSRLRDLTGQMLQRLDRRERLIIRSRFALGSHRRVRSLQELANRLGVSKERVRQIEGQAVSKLRAMTKDLDLDDVHLSLD